MSRFLLLGLMAAGVLHAEPLDQVVRREAPAQLTYLFDRIAADGDATVLDGQRVFATTDKFLAGKTALGSTYVLLGTPESDPRFGSRLDAFRGIADMTSRMENQTWGIYYYVLALYKLKQAGLLERAVDPGTLARLQTELDWRKFVELPEYQLISLPTNYYGVAFSIARLRHLLGWEDASGSDVLMKKMLDHYARYSGKFGFSDETPGEGRFDRYSILLAAEICERYIETGLPVTPELKSMLRRSADVALALGNPDGYGFTFGRSLGPYGETAILEILSASAYLGILSPEEKAHAYAYSARIAQRYFSFWYDPARHTVDMWNQGRRTDTYRANHRLLGENFSLLHQLMSTSELWARAGMQGVEPAKDFSWFARTQPPMQLVRFADGQYDRALAIVRDGSRVFSLNMVNGGASQYDNSPYYPLPFSTGVVSGVADSGAARPQLTPKFTLADGSELIATSYFQNIQAKGGTVTYSMDAMARLGKSAPTIDARIRVDTRYAFKHGKITRTDTYTPQQPLDVARVSLDFASFSEQGVLDGRSVRFGKGAVTNFRVNGLSSCQLDRIGGDDRFKAPYGPMHSLVSCALPAFTLKSPLIISWTLTYRP